MTIHSIQHGLRLYLLVLLGSLCLFSSSVFGTGLQASLDRARIAEGETVLLRLSIPGQHGATPDLSPLVQDFDVLDRTQSTRMQIINGRSSTSYEWQFVLAPKRTGQLLVPSLQAGNLRSQPVALTVLPAQQAAQAGAALPVTIEVEALPAEPYVQQKVIYNVRVWIAVPLTRTNLGDPEGHGIVVEPLGDFKRQKLRRGGKEYLVVERSYALFPQQSGPLVINGPLFTGQMLQQDQRQRRRSSLFSDPFDSFNNLFGSDPFATRSRMVHMRGRDITLNVKPQPAGVPQPWLPAEAVTLEESWSPNVPQFRVGEPVTRSVVLNVRGVSNTQLPELTFDSVPGISIYQDKSQVHNRLVGMNLLARKVFKAAYVPSWPGTHKLPEIALSWWDTYANQLRVARVPERTIEVLPGVGGAATRQSATPTAGTEPSPTVQPPQASEAVAAPPEDASGTMMQALMNTWDNLVETAEDANYWPWVTALFAVAWLLTAGLWWRARQHRSKVESEPIKAKAPDLRVPVRLFRQACKDNDPRAARESLLAWAEAYWPDEHPRGLNELACRLPQHLAGHFAALDRELYASGERAWDGAAAWEALAPVLQSTENNPKKFQGTSVLPPLYPHQG